MQDPSKLIFAADAIVPGALPRGEISLTEVLICGSMQPRRGIQIQKREGGMYLDDVASHMLGCPCISLHLRHTVKDYNADKITRDRDDVSMHGIVMVIND